ncbi:MAG: hypothetical protein AAFW89_01780 [Bacteroidota bacterium]
MKNFSPSTILELTCRLYVFFFLNIYGFAKLFGGQFYTPDSMPAEVGALTLADAPNFELAWVFMGRSFGYLLFIGLGEIIGAWLLLFNKTKLLGGLILGVIMTNVIVFDVFFLDAYGALASASVYYVMLIYIAYFNREEVMGAFKHLLPAKREGNRIFTRKNMMLFVSAVALAAVIFLFDQLLVNWFGHGKG